MENPNIDKLTKLAEQGDATAIRELADYYLEQKNYKNALELYLKLADQNDAEVLRRIGYCCFFQKDYKKAVEWWFKAAEMGNPKAQNHLGYSYQNGVGVEQDLKKAVEWYSKAAEGGNAIAQYNLGLCYNKGKGVEQDYKKAAEWYTKAADQGDAPAQCNLGNCYKNGEGVEQDQKKAVEWYTKAAEGGNVVAQFNLGNCYKNGEGVEQDQKKAVEWYTKAAEQGNAVAQRILGACYHIGEGIERDYKKAVEWYTKAAEQGDIGAINNLGVCYRYGTGVERDAKKDVELFTKSSELGNAVAQRNLGDLYRDGKGVEQNYQTAEQWYKKAAEQGDEDAKKALNDMYENGLVIPADAPRCHDADFGELAYARKKGWKGKFSANFNGKETELAIELEGTKDDKVTDAQRKAYAEYKESDFFKAMIAKAKELYKDVDVIYPKTLFIDRQGNYGWMGPKTVILSDGDVQFAASNNVLYNYVDVIANRTKKEWHEWDTIYLNLLGELDAYSVERDDYRVDEYEDEEIRNGKLTEQEVDLLLWLTNECDTSGIADEVLEYCNAHYESACYYDKEKKDYVDFELIEKTDLFNEVAFSSVRLMTKLAEDTSSPDMAIVGECECDPDHGIAICFCEIAYDGICSHADVL